MMNGISQTGVPDIDSCMVRQQVNTAVTKKVLDTARSQGEMIVDMIKDTASTRGFSAEPHKGNRIDVRA